MNVNNVLKTPITNEYVTDSVNDKSIITNKKTKDKINKIKKYIIVVFI